METIRNNVLEISVITEGAELCSIRSLATSREYMWEGNPEIWGSHAPVLFPIVGTLKDQTYFHNGKAYELPRHGFFRRNAKVTLLEKSSAHLTFGLKSDPESLSVYPFDFEAKIIFSLDGNKIRVTHNVKNTGTGEMLFSIGGHPAFKCPLNEGETYEDYQLIFEKEEFLHTWDLNEGGIIEKEGRLVMDHSNILPLHKNLFDHDALIFKYPVSNSVSLAHHTQGVVVKVDFTGWPYLGIWAKPQAPFVCIEPWLGIADSADTDQQLSQKEGILSLAEGKVFEATFSIEIVQ
ncbi:MAG: aldose 1-epimerase family protein [Bacteroidia bacterium]